MEGEFFEKRGREIIGAGSAVLRSVVKEIGQRQKNCWGVLRAWFPTEYESGFSHSVISVRAELVYPANFT